MTVTMFSITPPTRHASVYMMRKTQLNGPRTTPLPKVDRLMCAEHPDRNAIADPPPRCRECYRDWVSADQIPDGWTRAQRETYRNNRASGLGHEQAIAATQRSLVSAIQAEHTLDDIDDWYSQTIEDDGFLERLDRSAESVRFP